MKVPPIKVSRIVQSKTVKRGVALAAPIIASTKEAAAHAAPFYHMHDSHGNTVGMGIGIALFLGTAIATGVALYKRYGSKVEEVKAEKPKLDFVENAGKKVSGLKNKFHIKLRK